MKTVFTNQQCMHVYAQQRQDQGRTNNGNVFFSGATIYSYGHHFPMCHILDDGKTALYNNDTHSVSTSQQQADLRQAIRHYDTMFVTTQFLKDFLWGHSFSEAAQNNLVKSTLSKVVGYLNSAAKRRKPELKASDINGALYELTNAEKIFNHFEVKTPKEIRERIKSLQNDADQIISMHKTYLADKEAERKAAKAKEQAELSESAEKWKSGEPVKVNISRLDKTLLRINGDIIETSKGARFPLEHGKLAFKIIYETAMNKRTWQRNGKSIHLGHFQIDRIDENGHVTAGCHFVEFDEISDIAHKLGLV